jgi:hypothetical protein
MKNLIWPLLGIVACLNSQISARAQAVAVTLRLDTNNIAAGGSTVLHVLAQVVPAVRTNAERIFSWYVDVLHTNGAAVQADYAAMTKTASDREPSTSSTGSSSGANRVGIYDTFLNLPGAGVSNAVELMAIPVRGLTAGVTRFSIRAGTEVGLSNDFIVNPKTGTQEFTGGDYRLAIADLTVTGTGGCGDIRLQLLTVNTSVWQLRFTPCPGRNHTVEFRNALGVGAWQPWPGAPHNSGVISVTNVTATRFFRVRTDVP